jgi:3-dehydroquinate dehydratase
MKIYSPKIYKIAVTPNNIEDVENILKLNKYFKVEFNNFPIIQFHKGDEQKKYYKNIFVSM